MTRALYETPENTREESKFCDDLAQRWGVTMRKLAPQYSIDRLCFRDGEDAVAALEVKCLNKPSSKCAHYGDSYMNVEKYLALQNFAAIGLPSIYAVRLSDGDFFYKVTTGEYCTVRLVGRSDRDDPLDIKPVVRLAWDKFKRISGPLERQLEAQHKESS